MPEFAVDFSSVAHIDLSPPKQKKPWATDFVGWSHNAATYPDQSLAPFARPQPEFIAKDLRKWLAGIGVKTAYITPSSPCENGFYESFNGTFRDNLLDGETFYSL